MNEKLLEYFEFIYDRQLIWHKKSVLNEAAPWSDDKLFQTFKFCNIYRELDRVSKVIDETICKDPNMGFEQKFFNIIAGRVFNLDYTFTQLTGILDPSNFNHKYYEDLLDSKIKKGVGIWNSAYTLTQMKYDANYRKEKHAQFLLLFQYIADNISFLTRGMQKSKTLREATLKLCNLPLIGEFLAGEIVQDLTYCRPFFFANEMNDDNDLCPVGPGTIKAISETFPESSTDTNAFTRLIIQTHAAQKEYFRILYEQKGKNWKSIAYTQANTPGVFLSINNIESAFCEKRKYDNLKSGNGRKRYYRDEQELKDLKEKKDKKESSVKAPAKLKSSEEWQKQFNVAIIDPDGWDRENLEFSFREELITKKEFESRLSRSTRTLYPNSKLS